MAIGFGIPVPKGERRQTARRRKVRQEAAVIKAVRAECVIRDGRCRYNEGYALAVVVNDPQPTHTIAPEDSCNGPSEWAHLHAKRRSKTRGMAPDARHDSAHSLMLCRAHHRDYDAHRLHITALTRQGANGPLKFRRVK